MVMGEADELAMASAKGDLDLSDCGPLQERHRTGAGLANRIPAKEGAVTEHDRLHTRRSAIKTALAAAGASASIIANARATIRTGKSTMAEAPGHRGDLHDWDFLFGRWTVRHRRLKARLVGNTEWEEFAGTSVVWPTLGGQGTVDDNVIELPGGSYRGVGIRAFDAKAGHWSIWWLDSREPNRIFPPVRGSFKNGVWTFVGDDTLNDRPIKVRFRWSEITPTSAHWEQAFSPDGGATWEINWVMWFTRARP